MPTTIFSPDQLKQLVTKTLVDVPKDHKIAVVGTVDQHGAEVVANFTSQNNEWQLQAAYRHDWSGDNEIGATVMSSR